MGMIYMAKNWAEGSLSWDQYSIVKKKNKIKIIIIIIKMLWGDFNLKKYYANTIPPLAHLPWYGWNIGLP